MSPIDGSRDAAYVLGERARALARPVGAPERDNVVRVLVLRVAEERYAVEMRYVNEVRPAVAPTPIPGVSAQWTGLVNVRGNFYPVLDLMRYIGSGSDTGTGMLVFVSGAGVTVALLVDEVVEAIDLDESLLRPSLVRGRDHRTRAIRATTPDLLSLLDPEALLSDPELTGDEGSP